MKRLLFLLVLAATWGCGPEDAPDLPSPEAVGSAYEFHGRVDAEMSGNVAQVTVEVDPEEIERGGGLWARSVPYLFLFSEGTRELFAEYSGLAGVRVVARRNDGIPIGQALLQRDALTPASWDRALNLSARARTEGTESPARVLDLVRWGEDHTEFEYDPRYEPSG